MIFNLKAANTLAETYEGLGSFRFRNHQEPSNGLEKRCYLAFKLENKSSIWQPNQLGRYEE